MLIGEAQPAGIVRRPDEAAEQRIGLDVLRVGGGTIGGRAVVAALGLGLVSVATGILDGDLAPVDADMLMKIVQPLAAWMGLSGVPAPDLSDLPKLEAGFYLFRDVAIGLISLGSDLMRDAAVPA